MNALIIVAGLVVALVGQYLNSKPKIPSIAVKLALAVVGMAFYGLANGWPVGGREVVLAWIDQAWLWALALPGAASLIGLAPGMATVTKEAS